MKTIREHKATVLTGSGHSSRIERKKEIPSHSKNNSPGRDVWVVCISTGILTSRRESDKPEIVSELPDYRRTSPAANFSTNGYETFTI